MIFKIYGGNRAINIYLTTYIVRPFVYNALEAMEKSIYPITLNVHPFVFNIFCILILIGCILTFVINLLLYVIM